VGGAEKKIKQIINFEKDVPKQSESGRFGTSTVKGQPKSSDEDRKTV